MRVPPWVSPTLLAAVLLGGGGCADLSVQGLTAGLPSLPAPQIEDLFAEAPPPPRPGDPPALRLTLGRMGRPAYATLLQQSGPRRLWRTDRAFVVATDGPRVVATSGRRQVVMATRFEGPDPLADPAALVGRDAGAPARRLVDLATDDRDPANKEFGLELSCRLTAEPDEQDVDLLLVEEACRGTGSAGSFTNSFRIRRSTRQVEWSRQWIGPGVPMLTIEPATSRLALPGG